MTEKEYEKSISDLFKKWIKEQKAEPSYDNTDVDIGSFTFDGAISPEDYFSSKERILFISKESNLGQGKKFQNEFWLKNVYEKRAKYNETQFSKRLSMAANAIYNKDFMNPNKSHNILKFVAFMNLNKRGGHSRCNSETLEKYVSTYKKQIIKEIEILNPTVIVCAGRWLKSYLKELDEKYKIIEIYHPSYYIKSDIEHLKKLEEELKNN